MKKEFEERIKWPDGSFGMILQIKAFLWQERTRAAVQLQKLRSKTSPQTYCTCVSCILDSFFGSRFFFFCLHYLQVAMEIEESSSEQNPNSRRDNSWKNFRSLSKMQYDTKETSKQLQGSTQRAHKQKKKCKKKI